jgi:hypothetical protein
MSAVAVADRRRVRVQVGVGEEAAGSGRVAE